MVTSLISLRVGYTRPFTAPLLIGEFTKRGFLFYPTCPIYMIMLFAEWLVLGQISNPIIVFYHWCSLATVIELTGLLLLSFLKKKVGLLHV